eukprot:GCRY01000213.1.p1 GENE.GCRY01000213.1~~GCRY01000213.1.p1  ORF type:complete len:422 (-),score=101.30 GCRY01000213.1:293-1507(-)
MKAIFLVLVLCLAAQAYGRTLPQIPNVFEADVTLETMMGSFSGHYYYDFPNQRDRIDMVQFGTKVTQLTLYSFKVQYQIYNGQCQRQDYDQPLGDTALPPFAEYVDDETVNGIDCEKWTASLSSAGMTTTLTWFVKRSDGRTPDTIVRFVMNVPQMGDITQTFSNVKFVGTFADSVFDYAALGCPSPIPPKTWTLSGYVLDATNGHAVSGAKVSLVDGTTVTTNSDGVYTFQSVVNGTYVVLANSDGYFTNNKTLDVFTDLMPGSQSTILLSPKLEKGQYRFVLSWGASPLDLDSHMVDPNNCEVAYNHRSCSASHLDVDRTNGYGPETITITNASASPGIYKHFVYIYSSGNFVNSQAVVKVYNENGLMNFADVPKTDATHRTWNTFTLNTATGALTLENSFS